MNKKKSLEKAIIKIMNANKKVSEVFDFFANMKNMEIGGAIKSIQRNDAGKSKMKHNTLSREFGILDHIFI